MGYSDMHPLLKWLQLVFYMLGVNVLGLNASATASVGETGAPGGNHRPTASN